ASYMDKAAYRAQQTGKALWNKLTHMDAYDVGGLTFEIASLFVSAVAVGKVAKGTNIGAKTAEMISLAKNSTKARILATVEKWGSKVDNLLAKSNPVIRQFGETLLDTRIPAGLRQEALSFADEVGSLSAFSDENKTLREVMHFSSQHVDEVVEKTSRLPFIEGMSPEDARRYEQWTKYAEAGIEPVDRVKLQDWAYSPDANLYRKYKSVFDNPKYYDQKTGSINWPQNDGFDGTPKNISLQPGTRIDRYGSDYGTFTSPEGVPYEQRAVAPGTDLKAYSIFEVVEPLEVRAGKVAPWFDEPGGGLQYLLPDSVDELLEKNIVRRIE
ncbi:MULTISPECIES: TNT domain-containing protein, partial [unclassified Streptococcus]